MSRFRQTLLAIPANWAESLFDLGRIVRTQISRGAGIEEVSRRLESRPEHCRLALAFACANDLVKLRAMVEDWSPERVTEELCTRPVPHRT